MDEKTKDSKNEPKKRFQMKGTLDVDKKHLSVQITVTIIAFFILIFTGFATMGVMLALRILKGELFIEVAPLSLVVIALITSTIIGTGATLFTSRHFFKPLDALIKSQKIVAKGDFSVRVKEPAHGRSMSELVKSFNQMVEELDGIEMLRNDFINDFSHEFKTPIVSIRGFALELKKGDLTESQREEYLDIIVNESDRLSSMSKNILLLSKLENQQIVSDKTEFFLDEQIRSCILLFEKEWTKKNLSLDLSLDEVKYYFNEEMTSHIWRNLIDNAIKFSDYGGEIKISLKADLDDIIVKVSDNGIGMDDSTSKRIFDKFYQGDASHGGSGNGLGLPLAKRIVELSGGKISVKSKKGVGTTFIVRLPYKTSG